MVVEMQQQLLPFETAEIDPLEVEAVAQSWLLNAMPHLRLLAQRLRGLGLLPKELQWWAAPRVCVSRVRVPRPMCREEARSWSRQVAKMLRELGYHTSARDVTVAWTSAFYATIAFAPPQSDQPGRLVIDLRSGVERTEVWDWAEFENDGRLL